MANAEKICRNNMSRKDRRWAKRCTHRLIRIAVRRDPENAPEKLRHVTRGWSD